MHTLKLSQVGNSVGAVFPRDLLRQLNVDKGDQLFVTQSPDGLRITAYDPKVEAQLRAGRQIMADYRETLRELAK